MLGLLRYEYTLLAHLMTSFKRLIHPLFLVALRQGLAGIYRRLIEPPFMLNRYGWVSTIVLTDGCLPLFYINTTTIYTHMTIEMLKRVHSATHLTKVDKAGTAVNLDVSLSGVQ